MTEPQYQMLTMPDGLTRPRNLLLTVNRNICYKWTGRLLNQWYQQR